MQKTFMRMLLVLAILVGTFAGTVSARSITTNRRCCTTVIRARA